MRPQPVASARSARASVVSSLPAAASSGPTAHELAVEVFERGFRALQERSYGQAAGLFTSILEGYPDEKELQERARVYLAVCTRRAAGTRRDEPKTVEERLNAATVAINQAAFDEALPLLRSVEREDGENDLVQYMLAIAHASLGQVGDALAHLRQAVGLNPENRYLAVQDADFAAIREHPEFVALLETSSPRRATPTQARSGR